MTSSLPLIRLGSINPLLAELGRRKLDTSPMLREFGLPSQVPASHELFVAPEVVYELIERSADLSGDKYIGFRTGSALDLMSWGPIALATERARTVGELLSMFAVNAADHSTATRFFLSTAGQRSTFGFSRVKTPKRLPAQNDAFYMGFMLRLFERATGEHWDAADVLFRVADPGCIPPDSRARRIAAGDHSGLQITFPSEWLFESFEKSHFNVAECATETADTPQSLIESVRTALRPHLHESDLSADRAAAICGHGRRRLSRQLHEQGTTLTKEIARLRAESATRELLHTDRRVADIARTVGFSDATIFSRAFKNWTGHSPLNYRRAHRSSSENRSAQ